MIKVEIIEPSKSQLIKTICFTDSSGGCFRIAYYDKKNNVPILEKLDEIHLDKNGIQSTSLLVGADYELMAYRQYLRNSQNKTLATEDYKLISGEFKLINRCVNVANDPSNPITEKEIWYDTNNNPCYIWGEEDGEIKVYTPDGQEIKAEDYDSYMQSLKDFETIEDITEEILKLAIEKLREK